MAFLAPLAPLVLPAILSGAASYGVNMYMQSQAKKTMAVAPPPRPRAMPPQGSPAAGSYVFENSPAAAVATGGDSAIALDPLGKRGSGAGGTTTMLGR